MLSRLNGKWHSSSSEVHWKKYNHWLVNSWDTRGTYGFLLLLPLSGSRIWSRGGPEIFPEILPTERSGVGRVKQANNGWGPGPALGPWKFLDFLALKYAFSHFSWYFFFKFFMYICLGTLQNIYFNMKDSDYLDKCNFPFLHLRKSRVFISSLV